MAWIEIHQTLSKHRKLIKASGRLSVDRWSLIGHLLELWWWGLDNVPSDGCMGQISNIEIASASEWNGDPDVFVNTLIEVGFIDEDSRGRWLHDWYDYAGKLLVKREKEKERSKLRRQIEQTTAGQPTVDQRSEREPTTESCAAQLPIQLPIQNDLKDHDHSSAKANDYTEDFETFWNAYPRKIGKAGAFKTWKSRIKDGYTTNDLIQASKNYSTYCVQSLTETQFIKHPSTFLGPSLAFQDFINGMPEITHKSIQSKSVAALEEWKKRKGLTNDDQSGNGEITLNPDGSISEILHLD